MKKEVKESTTLPTTVPERGETELAEVEQTVETPSSSMPPPRPVSSTLGSASLRELEEQEAKDAEMESVDQDNQSSNVPEDASSTLRPAGRPDSHCNVVSSHAEADEVVNEMAKESHPAIKPPYFDESKIRRSSTRRAPRKTIRHPPGFM